MNKHKSNSIEIKKENSFKNPRFIILSFLLLGVLLLTYSNHFKNEFQFDDFHTIVDNLPIRDLNFGKFFGDGKTFSSLPANQVYRPYITSENAIDYKLAGGMHPTAYHIHIFLTFLLVCALLCVFAKKIFDKIGFSDHNLMWSLFIAAIFGLLCANAETVNYIIQRAEIDAGLYILLGFIFFLHRGVWRKWHLYLVFPMIGFFAKEMALMFAPLLLLYIIIAEEETDLLHFYKKAEFNKVRKALMKTTPAFVITLVFYLFYLKMLPETFTPGGFDRFTYMITQPMAICHYILTFFVPYNLSADSDWKAYESILDYRAWIGFVLLAGLIYVALRASRKKETKLFSFGLFWFLIALFPTSSFIPFAEVINDHRCFIPYMGLTIAFVSGTKYLLEKYFSNAIKQKSMQRLLIVLSALFLGGNAYGVYQRNIVWKTAENLWKDVTIKSPKNGRGLMNYGLALMAKGDYPNAEIYFNKAIEIYPTYDVAYVNLGLLKERTGDNVTAENCYKTAISLHMMGYLSTYYYGNLLLKEARYQEAKENLIKSLEVSPNFYSAQVLLMEIYHNMNEWDNLKNLAQNVLKPIPNDSTANAYLDFAINRKSAVTVMEENVIKSPSAERYQNLSLKYYQLKNYKKCIWAAQEAIKLDGSYAKAYNNIGISYFNLNDYDKAIEAYKKALSIDPNYTLTKNNLAEAEKAKSSAAWLEADVLKSPTAEKYINLSVLYFNHGEYEKCIEASIKALNLNGNSSESYNNIGIANYNLFRYDNAISAYKKALVINPNNNFAKNNMADALNKKNAEIAMEEAAGKLPTAEKYLDLSLKYYQMKNFKKCIEAANKAVKMKNNYAEAYNNIGIANYQLMEYDKAIKAYQKALFIKPDYTLAKNNMAEAVRQFENKK